MPSPFPGMNPYLEQADAWENFHDKLILHAQTLLVSQVLPRYIVKTEERIYIHELAAEERRFLGRGDVSLAGGAARERPSATAASATIEAPMFAHLPKVDVERIPFIEIRDRRNRQLITVIELLSPSNKKPGPDRDQYLLKRQEILASPVHFVEIDLLRGWERMPVEDAKPSAYRVIVSRSEERPKVGVWPIQLTDPLPTIPIPLREGEPPAQLDLQAALQYVYDAAGYKSYIYEGEPEPEMTAEEREWAQGVLG
jgi:hypothetical protein